MNDRREDGYALTRKAERDIEGAARQWANAAKAKLAAATTPEEALAAVELSHAAYMPEWCEYDQDYSDFAEACESVRPRLGAADIQRLGIPQVRFDPVTKKSWLGEIEVRWEGCPPELFAVAGDLPDGIVADSQGRLYS